MSAKKFSAAVLSFIAAVSVISSASFSGTEKITASVTPNPVISRKCPAFTNSGVDTTYANDEAYFSFWNAPAGSYIAYDLSAVPDEQKKEVIAVWYNTTGAYDYTILDYSSSNGCPSDYTIEVNKADGGDYPEDGWEIVETVENNTCHSRQHALSMEGYNWIRLNVTKADGKESGQMSINLDIHNVSDGISDSWIFYGDSITACGMNNCYGTGFATYINKIDENFFPVQENGGVGGITSTHGVQKIDEWLSYFPGKYVSIAYGTNDSWGNQTGAKKYYENTVYMIEKVIEAGKTPVLPTIPYSLEPGVNTYLSEYNDMVRKIYDEYPEVIKGPDFETIFKNDTDLLSADGVHPNDTGYDTMRQIWAETMYKAVYSSESTPSETIKGDINSDGIVSVSDVSALIKFLIGDSTEINQKAADMNDDGKTDIIDLIFLKNYLINN